MKVISYSIFRAPCEKFEFMAYLRGLYFNARMNRLIYPDWKTWIHVENSVYLDYKTYFDNLPVDRIELLDQVPICEAMLWRMRPLFHGGTFDPVTHVLCRDADAITTYRESKAVEQWVDSGKSVHAILDNPAHSGLMGGMIGLTPYAIGKVFKRSLIKAKWNDLVMNQDLSQRGSDQDLLNRRILPLVKDDVLWSESPPTKKDSPLWESDLTCRHIGSAGVVEMETLRFFKRFDKTDYSEFEKQHSDICYWARN